MHHSHTGPADFTARGIARGLQSVAPIALFVIPFGMSFGIAGLSAQIDPLVILSMSMFIFAGAAQFAVLDLWSAPLPMLAITLTVLAVCARHLIYGMALAPWLLQVPSRHRFLALGVLTDINYAHTLPASDREPVDAGFLLGGGIAIWSAWVTGTVLGLVLGAGITEPAHFGLDTVMVAYFAPIAVQFWSGRSNLLPWGVAATAAAISTQILPVGWPVVVGALAGGLAGMIHSEE